MTTNPSLPPRRRICSCCGRASAFTCKSCELSIHDLDCWCLCTVAQQVPPAEVTRYLKREEDCMVTPTVRFAARGPSPFVKDPPANHHYFQACSEHGVVPHVINIISYKDNCLWCTNRRHLREAA